MTDTESYAAARRAAAFLAGSIHLMGNPDQTVSIICAECGIVHKSEYLPSMTDVIAAAAYHAAEGHGQ